MLAIAAVPALFAPVAVPLLLAGAVVASHRSRARALGIAVGILAPGPGDAITDVAGVRVGHTTVIEGGDVRTGVTVVLPHAGNVFRDKVPAAVHIANGFGKLAGISQVRELGTLETPIALTGTLNTFRVADGVVDWVLSLPGNEEVDSVNPVVGECNDGFLSDARRRPVTRAHVLAAIAAAAEGPVAEGSVGAGTGTRCLGFKGGIGTASRHLPASLGGWTLGVLVQTNFSAGALCVAGAPVGVELGRHSFREELEAHEQGSCMIVVATDAPLDARQLGRIAARTPMGLSRAGGFASNGSGDYAVAFCTHPACRVAHEAGGVRTVPVLADEELSPLLLAAVEASEEAVLDSLFMATTVTGFEGHTCDAIPLVDVVAILARHTLLAPR
jgi:D-aminopeptidase